MPTIKPRRGLTAAGLNFCVSQYPESETLLLQIDGKPDDCARYIPHVKAVSWRGREYASLSAFAKALAASN